MLNFEHKLYLKRETPYLKYDMNILIKSYISLIGDKDFPSDYEYLYKDLLSYSKKEMIKPKKFDYPYRYYITTSTFEILFIMYESNIEQWHVLYDFAKSFRVLSDSPYGNFDEIHFNEMYNIDGRINELYANKFKKENGFFPINELAMPQLHFFDSDRLVTNKSISPWQLVLILKKYEEQNIVDINAISDYFFQYIEQDD